MARKPSKSAGTKYDLKAATTSKKLTLPELPYRPARPRRFHAKIGLIACGGITKSHLTAYRQAGYEVVAFADLDRQRAQERRDEFYPRADVYDDAAAVLARDDVNVVDVAAHPAQRQELLLMAIHAGKHVLSQKPFVLDLGFGKKLCDLADRRGVKLAVNQNGRWAPYVSWMRSAIDAGLIGQVASVDTLMAWDHSWVKGTPFERIPHLVLYDFAIHWFDMLHCYTRTLEPVEVTAHVGPTPTQQIAPPLLAQVQVRFKQGLASMQFRAGAVAGHLNHTCITGSAGTLTSTGPNLAKQKVTLHTAAGSASPTLRGKWFPQGFDGTMSELLCAIEEDRQPSNSGRDNLHALALCFAAMQSAQTGKPVKVGQARKVQPGWLEYPAQRGRGGKK